MKNTIENLQDEKEVLEREGEAVSKPKKNIPLSWVRNIAIALALLVLGAGIGYQVRDTSSGVGTSGLSLGKKQSLDRENLDFTMFWQVWDTLEQMYLEPEDMDPEQMIYGAIEGMTASLGDPYTVFLPPRDNETSKEDLEGEFDGVGIQLGYKRDTIAVMSPLENHPAIKQGVKAGDLILHIKDDNKGVDEDTAGMTLQDAVKLIRGKKGQPVTLTLYRESKGTFDVTIARDTITIPSVELTMGDWTENGWEESESGRIAWLRLYRFGDKTQSQWDDAVEDIFARRDSVDGIVLDVRNNPGGYLQAAINLASDFIGSGVVVERKGRNETETYKVTRVGRLIGENVVVLINGGSASASEILAGALRDRVQTPLVGEKSFGKGTVQDAMDLKGNAGLHVTTGRWLLPSGDWIHEDGLEPDVEVSLPDLDTVDDASDAAELDLQLKKAIEVLRQ